MLHFIRNDAGTFKASINADSISDTLRVNSANKVHGNSALSITFTGKNGANKVAFNVHIIDIIDESKDNPLDFSDDKDNGYVKYISYNSDTGVLTFQEAGLQKIGALVSTTEPQDRKVKIAFKLDADEKLNLKNSSINFTNEFHLIKVRKIDANNFESILQKMEGDDIDTKTGQVPNQTSARFSLKSGSYSQTGIYEIKNTITENVLKEFTDAHISTIHEYTDYYLAHLEEIATATVGNKDGGKGSSFYTITYNISFADNYESDLKTVKIKFTI
ncbi:hypothetical protein [Brachyspira sp.]|uniref:hypothetical protein n=1 Tax=Brachyspira sp. TaxID=1977261 RepID=UPI003D7DDAC8